MKAGILCPISALPSSYGVGDFGKNAYTFVNQLKKSDIKIWQILPLNPLAYGNSPYQPYSSYAGDELYIDLEDLVNDGLLEKDELKTFNNQAETVEYEAVRTHKEDLLRLAYKRFEFNDDFKQFIKDNKWVEGYALFRTFKLTNEGKPWTEWHEEYKEFPKHQSFELLPFEKEINYQEFLQYYFFKQWYALKKYANDQGIMIIGDMPIYVGLDSADCWLDQEDFLLEEDGTPSFVAGVPPDYFSEFGQRWGNPIYDWNHLEKTNFKFWIDRIHSANKLYDEVRIDHFRGFDTYWKIPASEPTAVVGEWVEAPGYALFDKLFEEYPDTHILAEDLGLLRDEVYELRDHYNFKGMYIFQFHYKDEFDFDKVVVYSGTHDNDTLMGWYDNLDKDSLKDVELLLDGYKERKLHRQMIHYCMDLPAESVIIPVWDLLGEPETSRFNTPGTIGSPNWEWKMSRFTEFNKEMKFMKKIIHDTNRDETL